LNIETCALLRRLNSRMNDQLEWLLT
jgi:hypothetical protein